MQKMNENVKEILKVVFGGIGGIVLTLLFQYVLFPQSQSITVVVNGQEHYVTEDDFRSTLDANEYLRSLNEELQTQITDLQAENSNLRKEIDQLRQISGTMNGSAVNNSNTANNNDSNHIDIKGTVRLRNNENIADCPQVHIPKESQIAGQKTYEMTWDSFEDATKYRISVWKDANYGTADSDIIFVNESEVFGLSYTIDLTALEPGYTYGFNVAVDNHFSSPLLIELY